MTSISAQKSNAKVQPPLIDRELFFGEAVHALGVLLQDELLVDFLDAHAPLRRADEQGQGTLAVDHQGQVQLLPDVHLFDHEERADRFALLT